VHNSVEAFPNAGHDIEKHSPVAIREEDRFAPVSATGHMVEGNGKLKTKGSSHDFKSSQKKSKGKT
jgi:hypothetical protein